MKKFLLVFIFSFFILFPMVVGIAFAQNPLVKMWDKRYGGDTTEFVSSFLQTKDGGFLVGGKSQSGISGDKIQPLRDTCMTCPVPGDYWIIKLDSLGNKQWDKDFGGLNSDFLTCMKETYDGGFILGGSTRSGFGGDKTQLLWGGVDYWIIKIDSLGNKQWDKGLGGGDDDILTSIQQTSDTGYILGGWSYSGVSGMKTQPTQGSYDYWIIKTDSAGIMQWDKDFGGTNADELYSIQQTSDGGYILGGHSVSLIGGDKSEPLAGIYPDYWIIKTDPLGNKVWDRDYGGFDYEWFSCILQTTDGGYILGGHSESSMGGNKSQSNWDLSGNTSDYWIVKLDSLGIKQWDKDYGGSLNEELQSIVQLKDGGYLISGDSYSNISGTKQKII